MKLIFCAKCQDVVRLRAQRRTCSCGASFGYCVSPTQAVYSGPAAPLGIDDGSFERALWRASSGGEAILFDAYVVPPNSKAFCYMDGPPATPAPLDKAIKSGKVTPLAAYRGRVHKSRKGKGKNR